MNRMPAVSEPGSAIRSRLRFQELSSGAESVPMELGGRDSDGDREAPVVAGSSGEGFELQEDPSFLKDNNVQVYPNSCSRCHLGRILLTKLFLYWLCLLVACLL